METLKFSQVAIASKEFKKHKGVLQLLKTNVKKIVASYKISHDNGKDWRYVTGYQKKVLLFRFL